MDKEMDYIRRVMNFEDIKFELSAFDLSSDGLTYDEAVRTLALSRLRIEPVGDEIENETGLLDGFLHGIRDVVSGGKDSAKSIMNDGIKSVKNVAKTYESGGYTSAEKDAMDVLNGKIPKEEFASTFHSRSSWSIPTDDYDIAKPVDADKVQVSTDKLQESVGRVVHTNNNVASNTFNNNVIGGRKRKKTKVKYVTDNINRDIWTAYFQKFQNFIRPIVNIHLGMDAIRVFLSTGIEVVWKSQLKLQSPNENDCSTFMGKFSATTGVVTLITFTIGSNVIRRLGWRIAALFTPFMSLFKSWLCIFYYCGKLYYGSLCFGV
jgi:hypothetical protein